MNKLHTILLVSSLIPGLFVSATAQTTSPERNVPVLPSPRGNYLLVSPIETTPTDSATLRNTAYFLIERTEITEKVLEKRMAPPLKPSTDTLQESKSVSDLTYREVGRLRQVSSMQEVRRVFSEASIADLKKMTKQPTDGQLITYLQTHPNVASYPFFEGRIELQLLLGYAFLDEGVQPGGLYFYRVTQVDKNNRKTLWSEAIAVAGAENERLKTIRVNTRAVTGTDSSVSIRWAFPLTSPPALVLPPRPANLSLTDPAFRQHVAFHIAEPKTLTAQVKYREGNVWKSGGRLLPVLNKTGDSLEVYWQKRCVPDEVVRASLVLQDIVYNPGTPSDTSLAFAVSAGKLALIYKATARDTTDAIRVSWPRLPRKPYYTGIELSRSTDSTFAVVARLTATDTLYTDYHVRPGVPYIYHVKPLFAGQQGLTQKSPAEAVGQSTKFSPPLPVSDLRISQVGKNIRLDWKGVQSPSLYGYYVYRGTSAEAMIQLDGVVRNATSYIDSSDVLSGRRQYFYSVMTMNLTQDTSDHVPPVAMRPLRPISTTYPKVIDAALINGTVWLSWHDVRLDDNILDRFVLQRKEAKAGTFRSIIDKNTAFTQPSFIDTTSQAGQSRWYRVAAVTVFGDTTEFSQVTEITLPTSALEPVFTFYVRNITSGIEVSWPVTTTDARTKYAIYRRPAESETFARIGEVNSQTSLFLDTKVVGGKKYVYSVTSVETNGRESNRVKNLAVIRE